MTKGGNTIDYIGWRRCLLFVALAFVLISAGAQVTMSDLPYLCDFEDEAENAQWVLNFTNEQWQHITLQNQWVIGEAEAYTGKKSMYISDDAGVSNSWTSTNHTVLAYRLINLEKGEYDIAFDWKGVGDGKNAYMKVWFATYSTALELLSSKLNSVEGTEWSNAENLINQQNKDAKLNGSAVWQHFQGSFTVPAAKNNRNCRLVFMWVNTAASADTTSLMVDNLQIAKKSVSGYPSDMHVNCDEKESRIYWTGNSDSYEVLYREKTESDFHSVVTDNPSLIMQNMPFGAYEFWICGINGDDKTIYTVFPTVYLYKTSCFDILNGYTAQYETGRWSNAGNNAQGYVKVDDGYQSAYSRHTTHFLQDEYDERTGYKLKTVPEGEFGSIRLGNWRTGSEYESISFKYEVDNDSNAVLLLKYAIVLENPYHSVSSQPKFYLDITDESGKSIDTKCGTVNFHAPTVSEWQDPDVQKLWHHYIYVSPTGGSNEIHWQDWNTMGIDLSEHKGKTLTVTFTSYDCNQGGHFGYAYFTLNCTRSDVQGIPWGEDSSTSEFVAPNGFDYTWFKKGDPATILSKEQSFQVHETDTNTYICNVTYVNNPECGWSFEASAKPHSPIAEFICRWSPDNCNNRIYLENNSHIGLTNQLTGKVEHRYDMHPKHFRWTMPDGTQTTEEYYENGVFLPVPDEGGTFTYKLWVAVEANDSVYADSVEVTLQVPAIGTIEVPIEETICHGEQREFPYGSGNLYSVSGVYTDSLKSAVTGCDSIILYNLQVLDPIRSTVYDTICFASSYTFGNKLLTAPGTYESVFPTTSMGCDSTVTLHLAQLPELFLQIDNADGCSDYYFSCSAPEFVDSVRLLVGSKEYMIPILRSPAPVVLSTDTFAPGKYMAQVQFLTPWCDAQYDSIEFKVNLPSSIVQTKWDNVLAVLNEKYNGGYTFRSFQWYADGTPIQGATQSYYHAPQLDKEVYYSLDVTLADGTELSVCPFLFDDCRPESKTDNTVIAKVASAGGAMLCDNLVCKDASWYTTTGMQIGVEHFAEGGNVINVPALQGNYLLKILTDQQEVHIFYVVVK
ncbi:MAG: hypothetical protein NC038_06990 [Paludibacter sp.]|nr:hypothetical protein [Bacteroidales bacterium]MCM1069684.1 hypothetical protein [Prevotella sp.]MCM1354330.1 hypothetical protein [Bacteroides sp.]MCM1443131.1 hypothetical protein [Muribaculum sp.]MCM1482366.1 hypothetical protein [Paludibacter sp.]